jgi:hypothetical protein
MLLPEDVVELIGEDNAPQALDLCGDWHFSRQADGREIFQCLQPRFAQAIETLDFAWLV